MERLVWACGMIRPDSDRFGVGWMLSTPDSPDELVKHSSAVRALSQHQRAAVAAQQHLLEHGALQGEHQGVSLEHLHLVCFGGLHPQRHVASIALNQQSFQTLHHGQGVADGVATASSILCDIDLQHVW